jgi:hypothetical protein
MNLRRLSCLSLLAAAAAGFAAPSAAQVRTFTNPMHQGLSVNYCIAGGEICGEQVAMEWCRAQGYDYASNWAATRGIDVTSAAVRLDDGWVCRGAQCEAFASITCGAEGRSFRMPTLGAAGRATVISPSRRSAESELAPHEYQVLIPGCHQREPGVFLCETVHEYQHCRSLMSTGKVFGCRAGLAFDSNFAEPIAAGPDRYQLSVRSTPVVTVERGKRGAGAAKGDARFELRFAVPDAGRGACLQRDRYVYHATGPKGGFAEIDDTRECGAPISGAIVPHEDDVLQAYDMCEAFAAWGSELEQPIELLVAALFHIGPANAVSARPGSASSSIVAPYLTIRVPMQVVCNE